MAEELDLYFLTTTKGTAYLFFTFYVSVQYNLGNLWAGIQGSKNKTYAIMCILPFLMCYVQLISAYFFSNLWNVYPVLFLLYSGVHGSSKTAQLNLASCSGSKYKPFSPENIAFFVILYLDYNKMLPMNQIYWLWFTLTMTRIAIYLGFLWSVIQ